MRISRFSFVLLEGGARRPLQFIPGVNTTMEFQTTRGRYEIAILPQWQDAPTVSGFLPDHPFLPAVTMSTAEARRFAAAIVEAADRAERCARISGREAKP
jgi:hypothetical protein